MVGRKVDEVKEKEKVQEAEVVGRSRKWMR